MARRTSASIRELPLPLLSQDEWKALTNAFELTARQCDIVKQLLRAKQDKQIAAELGVSTATVRTHLRYLYAKLDVSDRTELVIRVFAVARKHSGR